MPGRGLMDDDDLAETGFGEPGEEVILTTLADSIAASAGGPDEALELCRDLATAENLDEDQYLELIQLVEGSTGFDLPEEGQRF